MLSRLPVKKQSVSCFYVLVAVFIVIAIGWIYVVISIATRPLKGSGNIYSTTAGGSLPRATSSISTKFNHPQPQHASSQASQQKNHPHQLRKTLKLPTPVIVLGYPKSGTTSVYSFFNCSGIATQHFCCCGDINDHPPCANKKTMAHCILGNLAKYSGRINQQGQKEEHHINLLEGCGDYQVYAQIDGERPTKRYEKGVFGVVSDTGELQTHDTRNKMGAERSSHMRHFLPQHFFLPELHASAPNATYILPLREPHEWAMSVFNWFQARGRIINEYVHYNSSIERPGKEGAVAFLAQIYQEHTYLVRDFVRRHPSHTLVEFNIRQDNAGAILANAFGLSEECWGHQNKMGSRAKFAYNHS